MRRTAAVRKGSNPWRENAAAELWLLERNGPAPKPVTTCRQAKTKPFLDGELDDECWQGITPLVLKDASGATTEQYETKAWLAYDAEYPLCCAFVPAPGRSAGPARREADARCGPAPLRSRRSHARSRPGLSDLLPVADRSRAAVAEDCWGDRTWNPRWLVAHKSTRPVGPPKSRFRWPKSPATPIPVGKAWCLNIVRMLPGRGVQAFSLPADVSPRPEGMGLGYFHGGRKENCLAATWSLGVKRSPSEDSGSRLNRLCLFLLQQRLDRFLDVFE